MDKAKGFDSSDDVTTGLPWICEINEEVAVRFHENINRLYEADPLKPIIIHINSFGGEVDAMFSMLDTMDSIRSMASPEFKFITVAKGKAISAGAVLLSYGDYRFATPNSRIMVHQVMSGTYGGQAENEVEFKETSRMNTRMLQIIKEQCKLKMSMTEFKAALGHNLYFTAEKAKEFGIIDIIGYPKVLERKAYEIVVLNSESPKKLAKSKK